MNLYDLITTLDLTIAKTIHYIWDGNSKLSAYISTGQIIELDTIDVFDQVLAETDLEKITYMLTTTIDDEICDNCSIIDQYFQYVIDHPHDFGRAETHWEDDRINYGLPY